MAAIMKEEPPELSESGRNISPALDRVVRHCLEKDRDRRFQSARDIEFALSEQSSSSGVSGASVVQAAAPPARRSKVLILVAAAFVLAGVGVFLLRRPHKGGGEAGGVKRIAVLPFENLGSPEDDYFTDGMSDEVRGKLTSLPGIEVIARGSSTPYKKTNKTPKQIAGELNVHYLLTATVRSEKNRRKQPRARQPGARGRVPARRADLEVAAAVRRGADGRVSGAVGHRVEGGSGSGRGSGGGRGEAALREANAESCRL